MFFLTWETYLFVKHTFENYELSSLNCLKIQLSKTENNLSSFKRLLKRTKKPINKKKTKPKPNQTKQKQQQKIKPSTGLCFFSINTKKLLYRIWCQETLSQGTMIKQNYLYLFSTPNFGMLFCRFLFFLTIWIMVMVSNFICWDFLTRSL